MNKILLTHHRRTQKNLRKRFLLGATIITLLLVGIVFAGGVKLVKGEKIKSITEIDCNKKYDENCEGKVKLKDDSSLKIDLINDINIGQEVLKVYSSG